MAFWVIISNQLWPNKISLLGLCLLFSVFGIFALARKLRGKKEEKLFLICFVFYI